MTLPNMKIGEARKVLLGIGWGEGAVKAALEPTSRQARDRAAIPIAEVNPEQHAAILCLYREGWRLHDIGLAIPVPESEIGKVLTIAAWDGREHA